MLLIRCAAPKSKPLDDAQIIWSFESKKTLFTEHGNVQFEKLNDAEREISLFSGGDGMVAKFDGTSWLMFPEQEPVFGGDSGALFIQFYPEKSGGVMHTNRLSVVVHESGLLILVLAIRDEQGTLYREIPTSFVELNTWHSLAIRYHAGKVNIFIDGLLKTSTPLGGQLETIPTGSSFIGNWKIEKMPLPGFPQKVVDLLFQKIFTGKIDHIAIWNRPLTEKEIIQLSSVRAEKKEITDAEKCVEAYRDFFIASRKKDTAETERLGLTMRQFMVRDKKHPTYHLTGPMDAILDPAGAFFYKGKYHVYSYRNMVSLLATTPLAHYVSDDLIHWKDYPIGMWADADVDVYGIWLANLILDDKGVPNMLYTALGTEGKFGVLAQSHNELLSFTNKKAVITGRVHHDGHAWKDGDMWYSLTTQQYWGERPGAAGDAIILLSSPDLMHWTELGEIFNTPKHPTPVGDQQKQGFTEYPYLIPFGDKYVLMTGTRPSLYWIGKFDKTIPAFIPDHPEGKLLDHLNTFHCFNPMTVDQKGPGGSSRRIIQAMHLYASGKAESVPWYGVHTLPRILTRVGDRLVQEPIPEAQVLRRNRVSQRNITVGVNHPLAISSLSGDALEIIAEFDRGHSKKFGLLIRTDSAGEKGIQIYYDVATGNFGVCGNIKRPSVYPELGETKGSVKPGDKVRMRIFIDHSLFEVFVNGETFTGVFNGDPSQEGIRLFSEIGEATLHQLDFWEMTSAWESVIE